MLNSENEYISDYSNMIDQNYDLNEIEKIGEGGNGLVIKCFD